MTGRQKLPGTLIRKKTVREKTIRKNRCQLRGESRLNLTDRRQNHRKRNEEDDQANPHIERLLAGAGIVAAIVVVAVLIVVFSKLGRFL